MRTTVAVCLAMALVCVEGQTQPRPRILIDTTKAGGAWWASTTLFGTPSLFPDGQYQGEGLVILLRRRGADVQELRDGSLGQGRGRGRGITRELLSPNDLVIRAGAGTGFTRSGIPFDEQPSQADIAAYREYVGGGGKLLLMSQPLRPNLVDDLAESFGVRFMGRNIGENRIERFVPHPITHNVRNVRYNGGSGVMAAAANVKLLGFLSNRTFLDLDGDKTRSAHEPVGAGVLGVVEHGRGVVVFIGDINTLQFLPQPLTDNIFDFLLGPR